MTRPRSATIPAPARHAFTNGISHPDLWLWDSWVCERDGVLHLYCLALSRKDADGAAIAPADRNHFQFHIRGFTSSDGGDTWLDRGCFLAPQNGGDGCLARNVWSGSAALTPDGGFLFAYTGIREAGPDRTFLQALCIAAGSDPGEPTAPSTEALSCPLRDYESIVSAGYYLGPRETLGTNDGEDGGPILAWRDPFVFVDDGAIHLFWSAKVSAKVPAVAHALLRQVRTGFAIERLSAPLTLPDADLFTQAEVPKLYRDRVGGRYFLLISACDRLFEGQPDGEVTKVQRLYVGPSATGPWRPHAAAGSLLAGLDHLFGASVLHTDFEHNAMTLMAPYTEQAPAQLQLTFAPPLSLRIGATAQPRLAPNIG